MNEPKRRGRPSKAPQSLQNAPEHEEKGVVVREQPKKELVLEGDPEAQLNFAMKAANALMKAVSQKPKPVMIRGEQYLEYGDWQTLARFFGATAAVEWTKPIEKEGKLMGYEARATVLHQGQVISSAEAMCMRAERNWKDRDEFMLRSMAQTRAAAKALRNAYGWVAELAGMKSTPAEEMDGVAAQEPMTSYKVERVVPPSDDEAGGAVIKESPEDTVEKKKEIAALVNEITAKVPPKTNAAKYYGDAVFELTGMSLELSNYDEIIKELKKLSPTEQLGEAVKE